MSVGDKVHKGKHPSLAELEGWVREGRVDTIIVAFTDMQGRLMGKRVQGDAFLHGVIDHGAHFCTYLLGTDMEMSTPAGFALMNWETGYGDWVAAPVWDSLRIVPWLQKTAIVLSDTVDGETHEEIPVSPRTMLKRQIERATAAGISVKAGSEFEYYVLKDSWDQIAENGYGIPKRFGNYNEDYHLLQATKAEPLHRLLRNLMTEARIPIEFSKGEAAPGQHEVNIRYDDVLESADRSVLFKHGAKEIAYLNGWGITFMAKPDHTWTGSSGHLHMSIWDKTGKKSVTHDPKAGLPYDMSPLFSQFVAGMMALSRELAVFIAPFINSYKRYASLSWAPVNIVWGRDNRTTGFRLVGSGDALHIENRLPGGDMNAYLVYAAMIGAGLYGIEHKLKLSPEFKGNGYIAKGVARMPRALYEAIDELERSKAAVAIFGKDVFDHYLNAARVEQQLFDSVVHDWERERYLSEAEGEPEAHHSGMHRELGDERTRYGRKSPRERLEDILAWPSEHRVLTGVLIAFVIVGLLLSASRGLLVQPQDLVVGDCLFVRAGAEGVEDQPIGARAVVTDALLAGQAERAACTASHGHEVSAVVTPVFPTLAPFVMPTLLDEAPMRAMTEPLCEQAFEAYVGRPLGGSRYLTFPVVPGYEAAAAWVDGGRRTVCLLARKDGQWMDHPARGSNE